MSESQVTQGTAPVGQAPAEQPATSVQKSAWRRVLEALRNNPTARKIAFPVIGVVVFLLLVLSQHMLKSGSTETKKSSPDPVYKDDDRGGDGNPAGSGPIVEIPPDLAKKGPQDPFDAEERNEASRPNNLLDFQHIIQIPAPPIVAPPPPSVPPPPAIPPEPEKYQQNPAVPEDISLNHPDAVHSPSQMASLGFNNLPEGSRNWIVRRFSAEAKAYSNCIAAALQKYLESAYPWRSKVLAQQQCAAYQTRLNQAQAKLKGHMSDTDALWILDQLKTTGEFLESCNFGVFIWCPITVPDFREKLNPEWEEWQRMYGNTKAIHAQRRSK